MDFREEDSYETDSRGTNPSGSELPVADSYKANSCEKGAFAADAGETNPSGPESPVADSYVAVDLETTGLNPRIDKIIEIAAIRVIGGKIDGEMTTLVNPGRALSAEIRELTGIDDGMLADAPNIGQVIGTYVDFCEGLPLLGHNIRFDYSFLKQAAVNQGLRFDKTGLDTLKLCRLFMPQGMSRNLGRACAYYRVELVAAHRAMGDARASHELYRILVKKYGQANAEAFSPAELCYQAKKEQPATKRQKEGLRELIKYHKINVPVQIDNLSRSEVSRLTDKIISKYGRIVKR